MENIDILLDSEESFNSAKQISNILERFLPLTNRICRNLEKRFKEKYNTSSIYMPIFTYSEDEIKIYVSYEGDRFHYELYPIRNNQKVPCYNDEFMEINKLIHTYLDKKYPNKQYDEINGYYKPSRSNASYFCWIPFGVGECGQSYLFRQSDMKLADYKWLANPENQEKLINYALGLCDEIIQCIKDNTKNPEIKFLI